MNHHARSTKFIASGLFAGFVLGLALVFLVGMPAIAGMVTGLIAAGVGSFGLHRLSSDNSASNTLQLVRWMAIGGSFGLVFIGLILYLTTSLPANGSILLGAIGGLLLGYWSCRREQADRLNWSSIDQTLAIIGAGCIVFGLLVVTTVKLRSDAHLPFWGFVFLVILVGSPPFLIARTFVEWWRKVIPTERQKAIPVESGNNHMWRWKLYLARHTLEVDDTVIRHAEGFHWTKAVHDARLAEVPMLFFVWGATGFGGVGLLLHALRALTVPTGTSLTQLLKLVGDLLVIGGSYWYIKKKQLFENLNTSSVLPVAVVVLGIWFINGAPGLPWLSGAFKAGSPVPWLLMALLCFGWAVILADEYIFGFQFLTNDNVIRGLVPLPLLMNKRKASSLNYRRVAGAEIDLALGGSIFGTSDVIVKETGEQEQPDFHRFRFLKFGKHFHSVAREMAART